MKTCPCPNTNHAITSTQRAYCKRALTVAYSTRDRAAIAKIKDALSGCPSMYRSNGQAAEALSRSADMLIKWAETQGAQING